MTKEEAIEAINNGIRGTIGIEDKIFNTHPWDEKRSKALRKIAKDNGVTLEEMETIYSEHYGRILPNNPAHAADQMERVRKYYKSLDS